MPFRDAARSHQQTEFLFMASSHDSPSTIGFLGAGKMATALAGGMIRAGILPAAGFLASDPSEDSRNAFREATGVDVTDDNAEVVRRADVVFLAVKPQVVNDLLAAARAAAKDPLFVSIAAGVTLARLESGLGPAARVIRVMPNTPCLVGAGACAFSRGHRAAPEDAALVRRLLTTVGTVHEVNESLLDAVTGLSGSGPAYIYQVIEAMSDGGVRMGLPRDVASALAAQTVFGAAQMVLQTGKHPGELKDAVTSPGGTTIAGLHELERGKLRATLMNAVEAATRRSIELGRPSSE